MIQNCQQFERRIQELMDYRIDPETDESLCAHGAVCSNCHESLMAYSLLHTQFLNDSDSMKIKLENLGLQEFAIRNRERKPNARYQFALASSIAATVLLAVALSFGSFADRNVDSVAVNIRPDSIATEKERTPSNESDRNQSLAMLGQSLSQLDIYAYSSELPGLRPFHALSACFDWIQNSWLKKIKGDEAEMDFGNIFNPTFDLRYVHRNFFPFNS